MSELKFPDGPKTLPLIQRVQWLIKPLQFLENSAQRYGDIFSAPVGPRSKQIVFISNPKAIQEILTSDPKDLDAGQPPNSQAKPGFFGRYSIAGLSGEPHKRQRKLLMPSFHGERMRAYEEIIRNITEQVTSEWKIGKSFSLRSSMQEISFQVILKAVFGLEDGSRYEKIKELLIARLNPKRPLLRGILISFPVLQVDLGSWSPWGRLLRNQQEIDELIYAEINERRSHLDPSRTDILSLMMAARDEAGEPMKDVELRDELITLLFAGHETTATSLAWAFYWIHHLPEVREKLLQELDGLGDLTDPNALFRLPYLDAVCKETLRIYPVALLAFTRQVRSPVEIMGYKFEPGSGLAPCIYLTHHREDLYPDPKQFKPERFLERQFSPYEYLPFGGGNRRCIGMAFAQFEMKLVLATILSSWQMELVEGQRVKPKRIPMLVGPSNGVRMIVKGKRVKDQRMLETSSSLL